MAICWARCLVFKPSVCCEGLFHQFMEPISPVSARSFFLSTRLMPSLTKEGAGVFLRLVVDAVNSVTGSLNDLRNFVDPITKIVDFPKQIQAFAALDLLFADIGSLNYSTARLHRISCAMSAFDKLANLVKHLGAVPGTATEIFKGLFSAEQCHRACEIVRERAGPVNNRVAGVLLQMINDVYEALYTHYREDMGATASQAEILDRIRQQRTSAMGLFLREISFDSCSGNPKEQWRRRL